MTRGTQSPDTPSNSNTASDDELTAVDQALADLPTVDPSDAVVARTLAAVSLKRRSRAKGLGIGLLVTAAALAIVTPLVLMKGDTAGPDMNNMAYAPPREAQKPEEAALTDDLAQVKAQQTQDRTRRRYRLGGQDAEQSEVLNGLSDEAGRVTATSTSRILTQAGKELALKGPERGPSDVFHAVVGDTGVKSGEWASDAPVNQPTGAAVDGTNTERLAVEDSSVVENAAAAYQKPTFGVTTGGVQRGAKGKQDKTGSGDRWRERGRTEALKGLEEARPRKVGSNKYNPFTMQDKLDGGGAYKATANEKALGSPALADPVAGLDDDKDGYFEITGRVAKPNVNGSDLLGEGEVSREEEEVDGRFKQDIDAVTVDSGDGVNVHKDMGKGEGEDGKTGSGQFDAKPMAGDFAGVDKKTIRSRDAERSEDESKLHYWVDNDGEPDDFQKAEDKSGADLANGDAVDIRNRTLELEPVEEKELGGEERRDEVNPRLRLATKAELAATTEDGFLGEKTRDFGENGWGKRVSDEETNVLASDSDQLPSQDPVPSSGRKTPPGVSTIVTGAQAVELPAAHCLQAPQALVEAMTPPGRDMTEGLTFKSATGYYENTYVPGDPRIARLQQAVAGGLIIDDAQVSLAELAEPVAQPFDAPEDRALAVFLSSDSVATEGPVRMTLQVGIKGAQRAAARRASLNLALVVDLASIQDEVDRQVLWSMADALANARQTGDRFTLVTAGLANPVGLGPEQFTHAEVRRVLAEALGELEKGAARAPLAAGMNAAYRAVETEARSGSLVGANLVLLATGRGGDGRGQGDAIEVTAHQHAVAGIHTSVLVTGTEAHAKHDSWARMGQGRRRFALNAGAARQAIDRELTAAGRAVARAVRLRIRLAEGVRLVEVIGSRRLDEVQADRVRAAEKAIDVQVAATTGITADRGEDEDGIQIVIPAFYAGDDHVILLDVVADGAGPIADVQARYKDLVKMDNGIENASLSLLEGPARAPSPRVLNVAKNRFAASLSEAMRVAGTTLYRGDAEAAATQVAAARAAMTQFKARFPGLSGDASLAKDTALIERFGAIMCDLGDWAGDAGMREHVGASLLLTGLVEQGRTGTSIDD